MELSRWPQQVSDTKYAEPAYPKLIPNSFSGAEYPAGTVAEAQWPQKIRDKSMDSMA